MGVLWAVVAVVYRETTDDFSFAFAANGIARAVVYQETTDDFSRFWSPSYFLATVGEVKLEDVKKYVQSQGNA